MAKADKPRVDLDLDQIFKLANQTAILQAKVRQRAQKVANRARQIDARENKGRAAISIEETTIPNGRYVCRVRTDDKSGEWGDTNTRRRATLRRARNTT